MHAAHDGIPALAVVRANIRAHLRTTPEGTHESPWVMTERKRKMKLIETLKTAAANRALYKRTRDEIARLPRDVALDIGIFPEDAHHIAWTAVYGK